MLQTLEESGMVGFVDDMFPGIRRDGFKFCFRVLRNVGYLVLFACHKKSLPYRH